MIPRNRRLTINKIFQITLADIARGIVRVVLIRTETRVAEISELGSQTEVDALIAHIDIR